MAETLYLPEEYLECIIKFLNTDHRSLESLSVVSKQFLSITNRLRISLTIYDPTLPLLPNLFCRFPNLTSLDLTHFTGDLNKLLNQISCFPLHLKSLNLSNHPRIPTEGLQLLANKIKTLTSLTCSNIGSIRKTDLIVIADCFPFLEELDLSFPKRVDKRVDILLLTLPKLRKINLSGGHNINNSSFINLCKNCKFLEEVVMFDCKRLTNVGIASAIHERQNLKSFSISFSKKVGMMQVGSELIDSLRSSKSLTCLDLSFSRISNQLLSSLAEEGLSLKRLVLKHCTDYSYAGIHYLLSKSPFLQHLDLQYAPFVNDQQVADLSLILGDLISINLSECNMLTESTIFALVSNCRFLNEIRMEYTGIGKICVKNYNFVVNPRVKSMHLAHNSSMKDENIKIFASICPNLQVLDMSYCRFLSEGIVEVLRCRKIMHLNLASCPKLKLLGVNFQVSKLEVLDLSKTKIDDETLYVISKSCCGIIQLELGQCDHITKKGVRHVIENCTRLREMNLRDCHNVDVDVVFLTDIVFSRPSLRKIMVPFHFDPSSNEWKPLLDHGCLVC